MSNREIKSFRDLVIWKEGINLVKTIYAVTKDFPSAECYGLTSQIRRAVVSIPSNIAEGHIRGYQKDFKHFLTISLGSLAELETQLIIAKELGYLDIDIFEELIKKLEIQGKQTMALILQLTPNLKSLNTN